MDQTIIIPVGNSDWIALTLDEYAAHKAAAAALGFGNGGAGARHAPPSAEPLLTAEELGAALHVPKSRIETGARRGTIPAVRCGRYWRFQRSAVERALAANGK